MTEERILTAVERIDGAMTRIEAAASRPPPAFMASAGAPDTAAMSELAQRHDTLRGRVEAAIAELDMVMRNG